MNHAGHELSSCGRYGLEKDKVSQLKVRFMYFTDVFWNWRYLLLSICIYYRFLFPKFWFSTIIFLIQRYGITPVEDLRKAVEDTEIILLAVKPQNLSDVSSHLQGCTFSSKSTLVSILAGVSISKLKDAFPSVDAVVRTMPNTPSSVREGMTLWVATKKTSR